MDAVDVAAGGFEDGLEVAAIFLVIDRDEALPDGAVFYHFGDAFEDDGFVGFFRGDGAKSVGGDVFCFASVGAGSEPEGVLPPDSPDEHEVRTATGTGGGDPIVM